MGQGFWDWNKQPALDLMSLHLQAGSPGATAAKKFLHRRNAQRPGIVAEGAVEGTPFAIS